MGITRSSRSSVRSVVARSVVSGLCLVGVAGCLFMEPEDPGGTSPTVSLDRIDGPSVPDAFESVVYEVRGADPKYGRVVHVSLAVDGTVIARARDERTTFLRVEVDLGEHWRAHKALLDIEARAWIDDDLEQRTTAQLPVQRDGLVGAEVKVERPVDDGILLSTPDTPLQMEAVYDAGSASFSSRRPVSIEFEILDAASQAVVSSMDSSSPYTLEIDALPTGEYTVRARWVAEEGDIVHAGPYTEPVGFSVLGDALGGSIDADELRPALSMLGVRRTRDAASWAFARDGRYTIHDRDLVQTGEVFAAEEFYERWALDAEGRVVVGRVVSRSSNFWMGFRWSAPNGGAFEGETRISLPLRDGFYYDDRIQALCPTVGKRVAIGLDASRVEDATPLALVGQGEGVVWRWNRSRTHVRSIVYDTADSALVFLAREWRAPSRTAVIRVDARTGDQEWDRTIPGARSLQIAPDGRYLMVTGDEEVAWLDRDGNGTTTSWPNLPWAIERVSALADGHLLVLGSRSSFAEGTRRFFRVIDPTGAVVRERSFESPPTIVGVEDTGDGWLIVGRVDDERVTRAMALELDRDGNVVASPN